VPPSFLAVRLNAETYPVEPEERAELERAEAEFVSLEGETEAEIVRAARDCDALLVVSAKIPASVVASLSRCRVLSRLGAGTDRIDVRAATEGGIVVANVPDFCINEQAEHTMALLLGWVRQLPFMLEAMRKAGLVEARLNDKIAALTLQLRDSRAANHRKKRQLRQLQSRKVTCWACRLRNWWRRWNPRTEVTLEPAA